MKDKFHGEPIQSYVLYDDDAVSSNLDLTVDVNPTQVPNSLPDSFEIDTHKKSGLEYLKKIIF